MNKAMDPIGIAKGLADLKKESTAVNDRAVRPSEQELNEDNETPLLEDTQPLEMLQKSETTQETLDQGWRPMPVR